MYWGSEKNGPVPMDFCLVCHELAKHSQQDPAGEVRKSRRTVAVCRCLLHLLSLLLAAA